MQNYQKAIKTTCLQFFLKLSCFQEFLRKHLFVLIKCYSWQKPIKLLVLSEQFLNSHFIFRSSKEKLFLSFFIPTHFFKNFPQFSKKNLPIISTIKTCGFDRTFQHSVFMHRSWSVNITIKRWEKKKVG